VKIFWKKITYDVSLVKQLGAAARMGVWIVEGWAVVTWHESTITRVKKTEK
jgi:hypothetical protein